MPDAAAPEPILYALSLRDMWCWAVQHLGKTVENRKWKTNFRGPFAIQLATGFTEAEHDEQWRFMFARGLIDDDSCSYPGIEQRPIGHLVATTSVIDVIDKKDPDGVAKIRAYGADPRWWFQDGIQHAWILGPVRNITPIRCRGTQNLFRLAPEVSRVLAA
jgi:hypothetical protein